MVGWLIGYQNDGATTPMPAREPPVSFIHPERLTGASCKHLRQRWGINASKLIRKAGVDTANFRQFERGYAPGNQRPVFRAAIAIALRAMVVEVAIATAVEYGDPSDRRLAKLKIRYVPTDGRADGGKSVPRPRVQLVDRVR